MARMHELVHGEGEYTLAMREMSDGEPCAPEEEVRIRAEEET